VTPIVQMPKPIVYGMLILVILAMIPPALIARQRATHRELPRIHLMQDMGVQHRFGAQQANPMFRDGRAMRPIVPGTVARGELRDDDHYYQGFEPGGEIGEFAWEFPDRLNIDRAFMERGRERYYIFCHICHGLAGFGDGLINERGLLLQAGAVQGTTWIPATSLHEPRILDMPVGELYSVITHGVRNMPAYGHMIPVEDRWAIVAYVRALQRSQSAEVEVIGPAEHAQENEQGVTE
jgi:hypothetical protein